MIVVMRVRRKQWQSEIHLHRVRNLVRIFRKEDFSLLYASLSLVPQYPNHLVELWPSQVHPSPSCSCS
jgi:hypothetical protein